MLEVTLEMELVLRRVVWYVGGGDHSQRGSLKIKLEFAKESEKLLVNLTTLLSTHQSIQLTI